jgi:hypothetical protein
MVLYHLADVLYNLLPCVLGLCALFPLVQPVHSHLDVQIVQVPNIPAVQLTQPIRILLKMGSQPETARVKAMGEDSMVGVNLMNPQKLLMVLIQPTQAH